MRTDFIPFDITLQLLVSLLSQRPSKPVSRVTGTFPSSGLAEAIASQFYSRFMRHLSSFVPYTPEEMGEVFELYHEALLQSDRDPKTVSRYWQIISSYRTWLGNRQPDVVNAKEFLADLRQKGYEPATVLLYYHGLRQLLEYLGLALEVKLRKPHKLPPYFDRGDIEAVIRQAELGLPHQTHKQKRRNKSLVLMLAYTGMRKSELLNLLVSDIDFNRRVITVRQGKGGRDRVIPMADRIVVPLREQCAGKTSKEKIFSNLNARSVYRIVTSLAKRCGLDTLHPHSLRHYFGTRLVEKGANLRDIQELMGHRSLETTAIYLDISPSHLRQSVALLDSEELLPLEQNIHDQF